MSRLTMPTEPAVLARERSQTWWWLERLFLERPTPAFLAELRQQIAQGVASQGEDHQQGQAAIEQLQRYLESGDLVMLSVPIGIEFARLVRGIAPHQGPKPPYESVQCGGELIGDGAMAVRRSYERAGLSALAAPGAPSDHLSTELRFLSLLSFKEAEAWDREDQGDAARRIDEQRAFLDRHLLAWLPQWRKRLEAQARNPFYPLASLLAEDFATEVRLMLDEMIASDLAA